MGKMGKVIKTTEELFGNTIKTSEELGFTGSPPPKPPEPTESFNAFWGEVPSTTAIKPVKGNEEEEEKKEEKKPFAPPTKPSEPEKPVSQIPEHSAKSTAQQLKDKTFQSIPGKPFEPEDVPTAKFPGVPELEDLEVQENNLKALGETYSKLESSIEEDYKQYEDLGNQLDELDVKIQEAAPEMQFLLSQKYNKVLTQHNALVDKIKGDTQKYEALHKELTKESEKFNKNIGIYNEKIQIQKDAMQLPQQVEEDASRIARQLKEGTYFEQVGTEEIERGHPFAGTVATFGKMLTKLPKQLAVGVLQATQGKAGASYVDRDWADIFIQKANKDIEGFVKDAERMYGTQSFAGLKISDLAQLPQNVGYSVTSMAGGLAVGLPVAAIPLPGSRVAAWGLGTAASGTVAYNATTYQIMQTYLDIKKPQTKEEEEKLKAEFDRKAHQYGLWEAVPEAISNLAFFSLLTAPLTKIVGRSTAGKILNKIAGLYGEELLTETVTQMGQTGIEAEAGISEEEPREWTSPQDWLTSFKEVYPQTFLLTTLLSGAGGTAVAANNKVQKAEKSLENEIGKDHPAFNLIMENIKKKFGTKKVEETIKPVEATAQIKQDIGKKVDAIIKRETTKAGIKIPDMKTDTEATKDMIVKSQELMSKIDDTVEETINTKAEIKPPDIPNIEKEVLGKVEKVVNEEVTKWKMPEVKTEPKAPDIKPPKREDVEKQVEEVIKREIPKTGIKLPDINIPDISKKVMPKVSETIKEFSETKLKDLKTKPKLVQADVTKLMDDLKVEIDKTVTEELQRLPELKIEPKKPEGVKPDVKGQKQYVRSVLNKEGIPIEWVNKQIAKGKNAGEISDWLGTMVEDPSQTATTELYFINNLKEIIDNKQNLDYEKGIKPEEEVKPAKESWQMTQEEFIKDEAWRKEVYETAPPSERLEIAKRTEEEWKRLGKRFHKYDVQEAIKEGKPVPEEVLKEYPELAKPPKTEPKAPDFKAKIEEKADHDYGKPFEKLTVAQKRKVIETLSQEDSIVIPDKEGEYTNIIGMPTRGFNFPTEGYRPFYVTAKKEHAVTDSHQLITEPEAVKKITKEWEDKILKAEIKSFKQAKMSQKEAEAAAKDLLNSVVKEDKPLDKKVMDGLFNTARQKTHEQPAEIQGHRVTGKDTKTTFLSDGQVQAAVNTNFLSFFDKYLPGYTLHLQDELSPIMIKVKGKEAGLVMPIRMEDDIPFAIDDIKGEVKRPPAETLKKAQEYINELKGIDKGDRLVDQPKYVERDYWLWEHKGEVYGYLTYDQKNYINAVDSNVKHAAHAMSSDLYDKFSRTREGADYLNENFKKAQGARIPTRLEVIEQTLKKGQGVPIKVVEDYPIMMKNYNKSKEYDLIKGDYHYFLDTSLYKKAHDTLIDIAKRYDTSQLFVERETPRIETISKRRERISDSERNLHKQMLEMIKDPVQVRELWREAHAKQASIDDRAETIVGQIRENGAEMDFKEFNAQLEKDMDILVEEDKKIFKAVWNKLTENLEQGKQATNHDIWENIIQENTPLYERPDEMSIFEDTEEGDQLLARAQGEKLAIEPETTNRINKTQIMTWAEKAFDIPIKGVATHKWKSTAGAYYPKQQIIRMAKWGELGVATHEIAHKLDYEVFRKPLGRNWAKPNRQVTKELADLDYDQKKRRTHEGFAEYMRYRFTTDKAAEMAPNFHKHFNEEILTKFPDLKRKLDQFKKMLDTWNKQGAENRIIQHIDWKGEHEKITGFRDKLRKALEWVNVHFNDEFYYPQKLTRQIEKALGKKLRPTMNPAIMLEYSKSKSGAIARTFVMDKAIDEYGNVVGPALIDILKPIARRDMKKFIAYAVSKKALNVSKRGIESGFDLDDAAYIRNKYKDMGWDPTVDEVTKWNNHAVDWLVRAGAFDRATAKLFRDLNPVYLPFKRAFLDEMKMYKGTGGYVDTSKGIKAMKGSGRPVLNPLESMITQMRELINKSQKIRIAKTFIDISEQEGMGGFITRVPPPIKATKFNASQIKDYLNRITQEAKEEEGIETPESEGFTPLNQKQYDELLTVFTQDWQYMGKENIVTIWRGGERQFYELHKDLYEALKGVDPLKLGPIGRIFAPWARMLRLGATGLKFSFGLARNPFRDAFSYAVFSKRNNATVWDPIKGFYKDVTTKPGEATWRFKKLGGGIAGQIGFDRSAVQNSFDEMLDLRLGKLGKVLHVVKHPVIALQDLISITEMGPRSSEIEGAYKKYTSEKWMKDHPDWTEEDAFVQAFNDAQDVTVNFTKSGKWAKQLNQITAFFNVSIRGPEKLYRSFRERPIATTVKGMVWITLFALGNWYSNKDKDWYKNLPPAYKYNNFWFEFGDNVYRLPIPFELGIIFASAPQAFMDTFQEKDDQAMKGLAELAKSQIPDPMPSLFKPLLEVRANKNWLGVPIESPGMQYLYPTERKREYTSKLAVALSKGVNELGIRWSPIQIDYMIDGYSGGFLKQFQITGDQLADYPVIGDLILRDPGYPRKQLNEYFSDYELLGQKRNSNVASREELREYSRIKGFYSYYKSMQDMIKRAKEKKNYKELEIYYKRLTDRLERYGYK